MAHASTGEQPQLTRTVWRVQDGLPENTVQVMQQTSSGYLWIGTSGGGVRFDGVRFTPVPGVEGSIFSMLAARDGSLWWGTEGSGLVQVRDGWVKTFSARQGLTDGFVRAILEDRRGRIRVGTDNGLFWIDGDHVRRVNTASVGSSIGVHALMEDTTGRIWVGGSKLLVLPSSVDPSRDIRDIAQYSLPGTFGENRIKSILQTGDGSMWIGTVGGLDRLVGGQFRRVADVAGTVRTMRQTSDGRLWVGTIGHGLYLRGQGDAFTRVKAAGQSTINTILSLFEDDSRQLWIGSQNRLFRIRQTPIRIIPRPIDTPPDFATISNDRGDALWAVSSRVYHIENGHAAPVSFPGLQGIAIRNVFRDHAGTLWVRYRWRRVLSPDALWTGSLSCAVTAGQ